MADTSSRTLDERMQALFTASYPEPMPMSFRLGNAIEWSRAGAVEGACNILDLVPDEDHVRYPDVMALIYEELALAENGPLKRYPEHFLRQLTDHWDLAMTKDLRKRVPPLIEDVDEVSLTRILGEDIPHPVFGTDLAVSSAVSDPPISFCAANLDGPDYYRRSMDGLRAVVQLVQDVLAKKSPLVFAADILKDMDKGYLSSKTFPGWHALRTSKERCDTLSDQEIGGLARELETFAEQKEDAMLQRINNHKDIVNRLSKGDARAEETYRALVSLCREHVGYKALTRHIAPLLRIAGRGPEWGYQFMGLGMMQGVDSCFATKGKRGKREIHLFGYQADPTMLLPALYITSPHGGSVLIQNICYEADVEGEKALVLDGALSESTLGFANHSSLTFDPRMEVDYSMNLQGLISLCRSQGIRKLLVNASHSSSHQSTHDFALYAALRVGMVNQTLRDSTVEPFGHCRYEKSKKDKKSLFRLSEEMMRRSGGFAYTHALRKRGYAELEMVTPNRFYNESFYPYEVHRGNTAPFFHKGEGLIRAIELTWGDAKAR